MLACLIYSLFVCLLFVLACVFDSIMLCSCGYVFNCLFACGIRSMLISIVCFFVWLFLCLFVCDFLLFAILFACS